jgi:two-component system cell cycle response regulator
VRVLVAEDEPVSRHRLQTFLRKWGYSVQVVADGRAALDALAQPDSPQLAVLDRMMPQVDGVEVCRTIRRTATEPYIYVILLTSQGEQQEIIEGFESGADDYITKPFEVQELKARLRTGVRILELQEQLISAREQLRAEAMHDSLTGLLNRAAFFTSLDKEISRARRDYAPIALFMADIDHFKEINDRYGHPAGDIVLRETARRLRSSLRSFDVIGRYGGEEFIVAAPECSTAEARVLAERFRATVCAAPVDVGNGSIRVTLSIGVAGTSDMNEAPRLLRAADEALYRAKHAGRNKVESEVLR